MGVDTRIYLPPYVQVRHAADVKAMLLGAPKRLESLPNGQRSFPVNRVDGVRVLSYPPRDRHAVDGMSGLEECLRVEVDEPAGGWLLPWPRWSCMWHWEFTSPPDGPVEQWEAGYDFVYGGPADHRTEGWHGFMPRASAIGIAVGVGLVRFFGGAVQFRDLANRIDLRVHPTAAFWPLGFTPGDGDECDAFQRALHTVEPLTPADLAAVEEHAAYKVDR